MMNKVSLVLIISCETTQTRTFYEFLFISVVMHQTSNVVIIFSNELDATDSETDKMGAFHQSIIRGSFFLLELSRLFFF